MEELISKSGGNAWSCCVLSSHLSVQHQSCSVWVSERGGGEEQESTDEPQLCRAAQHGRGEQSVRPPRVLQRMLGIPACRGSPPSICSIYLAPVVWVRGADPRTGRTGHDGSAGLSIGAPRAVAKGTQSCSACAVPIGEPSCSRAVLQGSALSSARRAAFSCDYSHLIFAEGFFALR